MRNLLHCLFLWVLQTEPEQLSSAGWRFLRHGFQREPSELEKHLCRQMLCLDSGWSAINYLFKNNNWERPELSYLYNPHKLFATYNYNTDSLLTYIVMTHRSAYTNYLIAKLCRVQFITQLTSVTILLTFKITILILTLSTPHRIQLNL